MVEVGVGVRPELDPLAAYVLLNRDEEAGDAERALEILRRIVPEYQPAIIDDDTGADPARLAQPTPPAPA